ncbi:hypothetical protein A3A76_01645 [Candidatus Woesebacteria bacterium RIFCSPLOWO2_01_FULL_39_23]|uniref:Uncharacterized protein n=1 Tax=Candidatus Woesebacteria bacterium RIFCSPHIGHO2_01_FULL_40_22 TaxID=1802499 RepID=A0A1F7YEN9_9BACT|nr:MAG: hypothetical protein A2141_02220 [Candidatus Woesebacteria bacterium RBG_16_40_11]OGM25787.1 MAG: hypothetical protein A2628_00500 [Candidatus Woesebacteria bacterium RIFCSPHIGHO2_01_FULL_40_22]OGM36390.1 MAG: hypothetical protein A3E41_04880 [Candidatus Woesebacteria bacterium RIFCSPHIGHO2_12_FULL_38_9]OGM61739.1 MAG: hypothetical protein A3A76_01645 [Candidatus Woesebacteria bacterium RIFCSPLOWO2_01_FULL_39_23]
MSEKSFPTGSEKKFNEFLVGEYLKYGSVDEVMRKHKYAIPISYANYQRILDKWGIIKAAGPNNKLSEAINFLHRMVQEEIPLEKLYKKMPPSFMTSAVTLYRVLGYIKEGITRRMGTALILSPENNDNLVLTAVDISTPRFDLGKKFGSISLPMTFSRIRDTRENAILRVMQYEVFTDLAIEKKVPVNAIPNRPKPFMYLDIADVRVEVFKIVLPKRYSKVRDFSSFRLKDFKFLNINNLGKLEKQKSQFRVGVIEAMKGYKKFTGLKKRNLSFNPLQFKSDMNYFLSDEAVSKTA